MWRRVFGEAVITFLLVFNVGVSEGDTFAVGGMIWCILTINGNISLAIMNPAITVSFILKFYLAGKLTKEKLFEFLAYILTQFVFAFLGALLAWGIIDHSVHFDVKEGYMVAETFFGEVIYTCIIAGNTHIIGKLTDNFVVIAAVMAMTVTGGIWTIGSSAGSCFNPAVALAINLVNYLNTGKEMGRTWIYILGPTLGAIFGVYMSELFGGELDERKRKMQDSVGDDEVEFDLTKG